MKRSRASTLLPLTALLLMGGLLLRAHAQPDAGTNQPAAIADTSGANADSDTNSSNSPSPSSGQPAQDTPSPTTDPANPDAAPADAPPADPGASPPLTGEDQAPTDQPSQIPKQENLPLGRSSTSDGNNASASDPTGGSWMLQTLAALGVVIALMLFLRLALQRIGAAPSSRQTAGLVEVLGRTTVGPRTQVLFLRISNQRVIVASQTSAGLQPLTELTDPDEIASLLGKIESARPNSISRSFRQFFERFDRDFPDSGATRREEGGDREEHLIDRTRNEVSGLLHRIRDLRNRNT